MFVAHDADTANEALKANDAVVAVVAKLELTALDALTANDAVVAKLELTDRDALTANDAVVAKLELTDIDALTANEADVANPIKLPLIETSYAPVVPPPAVKASYN